MFRIPEVGFCTTDELANDSQKLNLQKHKVSLMEAHILQPRLYSHERAIPSLHRSCPYQEPSSHNDWLHSIFTLSKASRHEDDARVVNGGYLRKFSDLGPETRKLLNELRRCRMKESLASNQTNAIDELGQIGLNRHSLMHEVDAVLAIDAIIEDPKSFSRSANDLPHGLDKH
jgi:hypothetical protein